MRLVFPALEDNLLEEYELWKQDFEAIKGGITK